MTKEEREVMQMALSALKEALDAIESWGSYASGYFQVKHDLEGDIEKTKTSITALEKCLSNDALEKKAENARELGLEY
jgi:ferritin-like metal-binding protein YciE